MAVLGNSRNLLATLRISTIKSNSRILLAILMQIFHHKKPSTWHHQSITPLMANLPYAHLWGLTTPVAFWKGHHDNWGTGVKWPQRLVTGRFYMFEPCLVARSLHNSQPNLNDENRKFVCARKKVKVSWSRSEINVSTLSEATGASSEFGPISWLVKPGILGWMNAIQTSKFTLFL